MNERSNGDAVRTKALEIPFVATTGTVAAATLIAAAIAVVAAGISAAVSFIAALIATG